MHKTISLQDDGRKFAKITPGQKRMRHSCYLILRVCVNKRMRLNAFLCNLH